MKPLILLLSSVCLATFPLAANENWQSAYQRSDVKAVIERIDDHADDFDGRFEEVAESMALSATERDMNLAKWSDMLEDNLDEMQEEFREEDYIEAREKLEASLLVAAGINRLMLRKNFIGPVSESWRQLRDDINILANAFGYAPLPNLLVTVSGMR